MRATTQLLNIRGNVVPDVDDSIVRIPNTIVPFLDARQPIQLTDTAPGSASAGAEFSFWSNAAYSYAGPSASGATSLGYLAPGLWELIGHYLLVVDDPAVFVPGLLYPAGIGLIKAPAVLQKHLLMAYAQDPAKNIAPATARAVVNLDSITQVVASFQGIAAATNGQMNATLIANRLL